MKKLQKLNSKIFASNVLSEQEQYYITGGDDRTSTCWSLVDTCHEGVGDHHYIRKVDGKVVKDEVTICDHNNCVNG
ncbi:MAG: grasp-with-spasm system A modified peptide [Bacteroidota bacterium]